MNLRPLYEAHALAWAERIKYTDRRPQRHYLAAVVVSKGGRAWAVNMVAPERRCPTHHAEARVLRKIAAMDATVYVARATSEGRWANARPCANCERLLKAAGVRSVVYTADAETAGVLRFVGR